MARRIVTLFGQILDSQMRGAFVLDVAGELGDAPEFGLRGQITLAERQCCEKHEAGYGEKYDIIRLPAHVADAKGKVCR